MLVALAGPVTATVTEAMMIRLMIMIIRMIELRPLALELMVVIKKHAKARNPKKPKKKVMKRVMTTTMR